MTVGGVRGARATPWRVRGDHGSATVELAVTIPLLAFLLVSVVQLGVWFHARQVAAGAARQAVEASRRSGGTSANGEAAMFAWLAQAGDDTLRVTGVQIRDGDVVTVTVTGDALDVIPGPWSVSATARGPKEEPTP